MAAEGLSVRPARPEDAENVARLLHDFNVEYSEPTPPVGTLADRARRLLATGEIRVLLAGDPPFGLAMVRFRPSIWTGGPDAYLEELYIAPARRGGGAGRALLEAAIDLARHEGAGHFDVVAAEQDTAAMGLYESFGMVNRERGPEGPLMLYYELEI
ncbi:MAG TPA: GNAT family N-acetyltransferase [Solirubrobacterales bacterium]|jgi:ribosomal protein S18 acetylase RimI-like enzyme